jgi:tryptophan-rich sensory protein
MSHIRVKIFIAAVLNILAAGGMCGYSSQSETVNQSLSLNTSQEYWNVLSLAYIGIVWAQLFLVIVYAGIYVLSD